VKLPRSFDSLPVEGRRVLVRADLNVPLADGVIGDDTRVRAALPTIEALRARGARVIVCSHLGRPKGQVRHELSLQPVCDRLGELLGDPVRFAEDCIGPAAQEQLGELAEGDVLLLENLRFHAGEEQNDPEFAAELASLADVYVNDAFGAAHRAHASVEAVARLLPAAAGYLLRRELQVLGELLDTPAHPFVVVSGGVKVADKIGVIERLAGLADAILIGGAMAYTFFKARGVPVGKSLVEDDKQDAARSIIEHAKARGVVLQLPVDHVVADRIDAEAKTEVLKVGDAAIGDRMGLDIGPDTSRLYGGLLADAKTVVWNGPMGVFEIKPFASGTLAIANAVAHVKGTTIIGGGDSVAAINAAGVADKMTHISTGGGASLEFLGGAELPGVAALPDA
jgi:phosphoglycerate kinase